MTRQHEELIGALVGLAWGSERVVTCPEDNGGEVLNDRVDACDDDDGLVLFLQNADYLERIRE